MSSEPVDQATDAHGSFYDGSRAAEEYEYNLARPLHNHSYLAPAMLAAMGEPRGRTVLDLGCGNGTLTTRLAAAGFEVTGADSSQSGIAIASREFPNCSFVQHDIADELPAELRGSFDLVVAAEVIEHLFLPRQLFARAEEAIRPGGQLVFSTPFHGYGKNLALALTNRYDTHWRPGWDYGHIKFFSKATLGAMAVEMGWRPVTWKMVGRVPQLAKTMILVAERA